MAYQHIVEVDGLPVIGRRYWVPCVTAKSQRCGIMTNVPIIGTLHADKYYFGVDWKHYHFDARFVTGRVETWLGSDLKGWTIKKDPWVVLTYGLHEDDLVSGPYDRLLVCVRQMPVFPLGQSHGMVFPLQEKLPEAKRRLPAKCLRCPHRGTPLNAIPVNNDGVVVCPAHGLAFDTTTRKMVLRTWEKSLDE